MVINLSLTSQYYHVIFSQCSAVLVKDRVDGQLVETRMKICLTSSIKGMRGRKKEGSDCNDGLWIIGCVKKEGREIHRFEILLTFKNHWCETQEHVS